MTSKNETQPFDQEVEANEERIPEVPIQLHGFDERQLEQVFNSRKEQLESIKQWVGLKLYHRTAEKIRKEELSIRKILQLENDKQIILSGYTLILDPLYFEQVFITTKP